MLRKRATKTSSLSFLVTFLRYCLVIVLIFSPQVCFFTFCHSFGIFFMLSPFFPKFLHLQRPQLLEAIYTDPTVLTVVSRSQTQLLHKLVLVYNWVWLRETTNRIQLRHNLSVTIHVSIHAIPEMRTPRKSEYSRGSRG